MSVHYHLINRFILLHLVLFEPVQQVHIYNECTLPSQKPVHPTPPRALWTCTVSTYIQWVYTTISQTGSSCSTSCSLNLDSKYIYTMSVHYPLINRFILLHHVLFEPGHQVHIYNECTLPSHKPVHPAPPRALWTCTASTYIQWVYTTLSEAGSSYSTSCSLNLYSKYIYTMSVHYHLTNRFILLHLVLFEPGQQVHIYNECTLPSHKPVHPAPPRALWTWTPSTYIQWVYTTIS